MIKMEQKNQRDIEVSLFPSYQGLTKEQSKKRKYEKYF